MFRRVHNHFFGLSLGGGLTGNVNPFADIGEWELFSPIPLTVTVCVGHKSI